MTLFGQWQPIAELTDELFDEYEWRLRLVVSNSCNGPDIVKSNDCYLNAEEVRDDPWDFFMILPPQPDETA